MRWKRPLSNRKIERLKREAIATATPYMEHARESVTAWRDTYLRTKAALMLDAFDERLVTIETPSDMSFADMLSIELTAFAGSFTGAFEGDLIKLRTMLGADTVEMLSVVSIEDQFTDLAAENFKGVALGMLDAACEAANAEARRRGLPGLILT